ncbi:AAA family ATPase [Streptomyces sp. TRM66268-LWL]|uniref:AAA family ATPase n=1 Tax=Streptomyces polyasparticus TaxID=2767826 RepID=A0ABR7S7U4_9ACTN|nr:LuxR family transcriptional regulator [Streptomyces polyasparticus]MBC9711540.1 AAA family ATPase [Streptomyces polyasparticus]
MLGAVETRSVSPVFVGRAGELTVLKEALARATAGEPQALLLAGEAGVGKTRLLEEFCAGAVKEHAVVALGGCVEIGAEGLPFAPFSAALRSLLRQLPDELAAAAAGQEEQLARLLPELSAPGRGTPLRAQEGEEESMARLFELTVRLLERVAAERPVVLVLEDLHWADASTRHLLTYLFRTLRSGRLVVIASYRSDDIHRRHPLRPLLAELDRLRTLRRIELSRFTRGEVRRQLAGILAATPEEALVDRVFERSDGNAFFVEELACSGDDCDHVMPETLRDLLLVRVEALPEHAQRVVRVVAEGGSTVEYELLAAVAGLGEDALIEALRAAVGANILLAAPDGDGYRFRHSLVREAISDDLLPGERSRLNRRYAEALEADPTLIRADEHAPRLASYWYSAKDANKALPATLTAAVAARRRYAFAEQLRLLERAMELWDLAGDEVRSTLRPVDFTEAYPPCGCDPATKPLQYLDLMAEAAVAGRFCGERERALKITKRALRLLDEDSDPLRQAWFWNQKGWLMSSLGRGDGRAEITRAEELLRGHEPSAVHAEILTHHASWGALHSPGPEALLAAERAVEYARMVGAEDIEANAQLTLAGLLVESGDIEKGIARMLTVRDRIAGGHLTRDLARVHVNLPHALESVGRSAEAIAYAREGIAFCRRYGLSDGEGWVWANLAESLVSYGLWDEAVDAVAQVGCTTTGAKPRVGASERLSRLALYRGEWDAAAAHLAEARRLYGSHAPQPQYALPIARLSLGVAAGEGRIADLRAELAQILEQGLAPGTQRYAWPLLLVGATAEADARGLPAAEPGRAKAIDIIRRAAKTVATPVPVWQGYERWVRAELLRAEDRATPEDWAEVAELFEACERPFGLARVRYRHAESLLSAGGDEETRARAADLLLAARKVAEPLSAKPLLEDISLLAQRARLALEGHATVPVPDRAADDPLETFGLTSRERDVLALVAQGHTNRQIAESLFISPKTASVHVSNILAKLGVAGRGEAAALAHRLRLFAG